jgi:hypothetical protein
MNVSVPGTFAFNVNQTKNILDESLNNLNEFKKLFRLPKVMGKKGHSEN